MKGDTECDVGREDILDLWYAPVASAFDRLLRIHNVNLFFFILECINKSALFVLMLTSKMDQFAFRF